MKKYLLFQGDYYYPRGGWRDYVDSFSSAEDAKTAADKDEWTWYQVVGSITGIIVKKG